MTGKAVTVVQSSQVVLPTLIEAGGQRLRKRVVEFFGATIRNDNTRKAYMKACGAFFDFLDTLAERDALDDLKPVRGVADIDAVHVAAWLEALQADELSVPTQKQYLAAVRMLLDHLTTGGFIPFNPALSVKAPRQQTHKGKTPTLSADEAGDLLRSIETQTLVGLRDRAIIGLMVFTFARVSAALGLDRGQVFVQKKRLWVRLNEKNGKVHDMPCHHTLDTYLSEYLEAAKLDTSAATVPVFQSFKRRPYGRGVAELSGRRLTRFEAWAMVQRRSAAAGLDTKICNHTFRGTGITAYLENGGTLENAAHMAAHASTRTTQLYERRRDDVTLDEVAKINIKG